MGMNYKRVLEGSTTASKYSIDLYEESVLRAIGIEVSKYKEVYLTMSEFGLVSKALKDVDLPFACSVEDVEPRAERIIVTVNLSNVTSVVSLEYAKRSINDRIASCVYGVMIERAAKVKKRLDEENE